MKYLNTYNLFESLWNKDITVDIKDILIDLEDDQCKIDVKYYPGYGNTTSIRGNYEFRYSYAILITKPVIDVDIDGKIDQLTSFMKSEGYPLIHMDEFLNTGHNPRGNTWSKHIFLFYAKDRYTNGIQTTKY